MSEDKKPREPYWAVKRYPDVERRTIQIFRNDEFVSCIESTTASDDFVNMMLRDYAELQSKYERAVEALIFYGFETAIFDDEDHNKENGILIKGKRSLLHADNGKTARQTLKDLGEMEGKDE